MKQARKFGVILLAGIITVAALELAEQISDSGGYSVVTPAEAIVGRPLTPVSYAGVARRSVRRCAVGVYYC